jgi:protein associated with RNAse G/E
VYVDVTVPPTWSDATVIAVDLDLDVVRELDGRVWIDDEDEFAEHQVTLGYPADVVAAARASADRLVALLGAGHPPYDGSHLRWFDVLASVRA